MVKAQQLTAEQKIIWDMQRLQASKWWKYVINALQEDKDRLIKQLVYDFKWKDIEKEYSEADIWRYRIELIEDLILMPQRIKEEYDPVIDIDSQRM